MLYQLSYLHFLSPKCLEAIESENFLYCARSLELWDSFSRTLRNDVSYWATHRLRIPLARREMCFAGGGESFAVSFSTWKQLRPWTWNCAPQKLESKPELQLNLDLYSIIISSKSSSTYWFRRKCALIGGENELMRVPAHEFIFVGIGKFRACTVAHNLFLSLPLVYPRRPLHSASTCSPFISISFENLSSKTIFYFFKVRSI